MFRCLGCKPDTKLCLVRSSCSIGGVVHLEAQYSSLWQLFREAFWPRCGRCSRNIRSKEAGTLVEVFDAELPRLTDENQDVVNNLLCTRDDFD